ncbi:adenylyl-sulfate kinase [Methyloparacoccus murrellii]
MSTLQNIRWHAGHVSRQAREAQNGHRSFVLWFTGLSGAGKSTLAHRVEELLFRDGCRTYVLDGDNVRHGLCRDLGFSAVDRQENIRRIGEMSKLMADAGLIVITAFISPFRRDRDGIRSLLPAGEFIEVHCDAPLEVCEQRDVKGLYHKARQGAIPEFTGISSPYEAPLAPEIVVHTGRDTLDDCAWQVVRYLAARQLITLSNKEPHA